MKIVPTILTDNFTELKEMIREVESFCDYVQIDIMDGKFTPSESIKLSDLSKLKTPLDMELHLMVKNPLKILDDFRIIKNIRRMIFHCEADDSLEKVIKEMRSFGLEVGLALNPETKVEKIIDLLDFVDSVLILSVNPGFYGSKFIPQALRKTKQIRKIKSDVEIGLDGGIKLNNISKILRYPLDYLCIGSAILKEKYPRKAFLEFKKLSKQSQYHGFNE